MRRELMEIAAHELKTDLGTVERNNKYIEEYDLYYVWNPIRGGFSIVLNDAGEKLAATSSVSLNRHIQAFLDGRRN